MRVTFRPCDDCRTSPDWREMRQFDGQGVLVSTMEPWEGWRERYIRPDDLSTVEAAIAKAIATRGKSGALKQPRERREVSRRLKRRGNESWPHVDRRETDVNSSPYDSEPRGTGQGRSLIEQALPYQLQARTTYVIASDDVRCSIALPVSHQTGAVKVPPDG